MNIVNKLTLRHLKENKGRTVVTTLGICVSVAMITAVFVAIASFMQLFGDLELISSGYKQASFEVNQTQLEQLKKDDRIERIGIQMDSYSYQLKKRASDSSGTGELYCGDLRNLTQMITGDYDGEIPKNGNEIAVEEALIKKNKLDWKIGDTVKIPIGDRYILDEGEESIVQGSYFSDEQFRQREFREYKVTAILHENPATVNFDILSGFDTSLLTKDSKAIATVELKEVNSKSLKVINSIIEEYNITEYNINDAYLSTKGAIDTHSGFMSSMLPIVFIVLVIIMIASVVLIYNSFAMSISERVRYLGMLASVGATKKQKRLSAYFEGIILGAVGIPIGMLAGIIGIGITLKSIGGKIISTSMIRGVSPDNTQMSVVVPVWAVIGIVVISILTIFISSFVPAKKASSVTPIDAIRQRQEIRIKSKKLKTPKIVRKVFGYEGELAYKNLKRNGAKSRVITASIALSVVLFLVCNYFCQVFMQSIDMEASIPYQIQVFTDYNKREKLFEKLDEVKGIDNYYSITYSYNVLPSITEKKGDDTDDIVNTDCLSAKYSSLFNDKKYLYINYIDDEDFNTLCKNNGIDSKPYYTDTMKGVLMNNVNHSEHAGSVFTDKVIGLYQGETQIMGLVDYDSDSDVCNLDPTGTISMYVPVSVYRDYSVKNYDVSDITYQIGIETREHQQVKEQVQNILDADNYGSTTVIDVVEQAQSMNTLVFVLEVFVYGFIALISLITVFNIINTISTGIQMRRKEFAMLKSVGTTPKGFNKMIMLESALYGIKALIVAVPLSLILSFAMNRAMDTAAIPFEPNWILYLIVISVVLAVVGLTMLYSVHKLRDDSIVETLKEDIN